MQLGAFFKFFLEITSFKLDFNSAFNDIRGKKLSMEYTVQDGNAITEQ